jgi:hypothetical protein
VKAEHENELTELVESERVIRECGKEKEGIRLGMSMGPRNPITHGEFLY